MKKNIFLFFLSFIILISCEPDDICLTSIPDTPKLIIVFYDESSGLKKEVTNLKIQGYNNEKIYQFKTTDSIAVPLKNLEKITSYSFIKDFKENNDNSGNNDNILINYQYNHIYISRACGYFSNYDLNQIIIENDNANWIIKSEIMNPAVKDEKDVHVKIFH
ncbi:MAG: hypothetical protein CMC38_08220 [Flavobacteriaceae bacterium]|nr:hypothetical protein [Flavobacteriaceae bacterium]